MQIIIDIDENVFTRLFDNGIEDNAIANDDLFKIAKSIRTGIPFNKVIAEIENIEIEGYIRDAECFSAGINTALDVIDKYKSESEVSE